LCTTDQLCGYIHAVDETDYIRAKPSEKKGDVAPGLQPPTIPSRPRAAYLGRSGPRQDLQLLRRNLAIEEQCNNKLRQVASSAYVADSILTRRVLHILPHRYVHLGGAGSGAKKA